VSKERLDVVLVARGFASTQQEAQALIMSGQVLVEDRVVDKPGDKTLESSNIRLKKSGSSYVGRGGDKIESALDHFSIDLTSKIAIDIGASTGGFTDCMLRRGASRVYAVDVGYNQLDHSLRVDPRVFVMEKTHALDLLPEQFEAKPNFLTIDVSFISVRKILPTVINLIAKNSQALILVKPQFELEKEYVEHGGVVRDESAQLQAVEKVRVFGEELGLEFIGFFASTLKGQKKGNQEYFIYFNR
jgi:23S rRNA (cytidine1920-2'-O)/16S rRNA (cytidine1409-2'-O)-methyltransferase